MNSPNPFVIIGAGQCGIKAAETLRQNGYEGELILIGDEPQPPYQRPPLSKAFLKGDMEESRLFFKADNFYDENTITTMFDTKVVGLDANKKQLELGDGSGLTYEKLLLATGTAARILPIEGYDLSGVYTLRSINDVKAITNALTGKKSVGIIGAGYIGLEVAASLKHQGHDVTVIEAESRVLARVMPEEMSQFFENLHEDNGVTIQKGVGVSKIVGSENVEAIELIDGSLIKCDLVLLAVGAVPATELAEQAGIKIDNGIFTQPNCQTSHPDIYAAGDCASFFSERYQRLIRLESVQNAIDQGKAAALAMLGEEVIYDPLPWFWSDQFDVKLQIAGLSHGFDHSEVEGDMSIKSFSVTYYRDDKPICVDAVNQPRAHMVARRTL